MNFLEMQSPALKLKNSILSWSNFLFPSLCRVIFLNTILLECSSFPNLLKPSIENILRHQGVQSRDISDNLPWRQCEKKNPCTTSVCPAFSKHQVLPAQHIQRVGRRRKLLKTDQCRQSAHGSFLRVATLALIITLLTHIFAKPFLHGCCIWCIAKLEVLHSTGSVVVVPDHCFSIINAIRTFALCWLLQRARASPHCCISAIITGIKTHSPTTPSFLLARLRWLHVLKFWRHRVIIQIPSCQSTVSRSGRIQKAPGSYSSREHSFSYHASSGS